MEASAGSDDVVYLWMSKDEAARPFDKFIDTRKLMSSCRSSSKTRLSGLLWSISARSRSSLLNRSDATSRAAR